MTNLIHPDLLYLELLILIFTVLSAFFSASETIIISANHIILNTLAEKKKPGARRALNVLTNMDHYLSMILIGNNIVNTSAAAYIVFWAAQAFKLRESELVIVSLMQAMIFLLFCEIVPKIFARSHANFFLRVIVVPLNILLFVFKPLVISSLYVSKFLKTILHLENIEYSTVNAREEINVLFKLGEKAGIIDKSHKVFIDEILSMHKLTVSEVMTPTIEIVSIEKKQNIKTLVKLIEKTRFSRIPVYEERVDNIVGYIYYRDLFSFDHENDAIENILHKPIYVPTSKKVYHLYKEMLTSDNHMIFTVNEYGAVEGLVTREDIAEEVVGEIQTRDHFNEDLITQISKNKFSLSGSLDIEFFERYFNIEIRKNGFETVAGFILYQLGYIPHEGEKLKYKGCIFNITSASEKAITRISVTVSKKYQK